MEKEMMAHNSMKIQVLREDYEDMLRTRMEVKQDLEVANLQLQQLGATALTVRDRREIDVKQIYERCVAMEGEARLIDSIQREHHQVVALVRSLHDTNLHLSSHFRLLHSQLHSLRSQALHVPPLNSDLLTMRHQLLQGRAAIEFEKKTRAANLEQYQAMEANMISIQNEIQRLRDDLLLAQKQARPATAVAASNPGHGYLGDYRGPDIALQGGHSAHYPMHQTVTRDEGAYPAVFRPPPNGSHGPFDAHSDS
ncbi:hypothetical protein vseg_013278 [Gypsophila vaccaria]